MKPATAKLIARLVCALFFGAFLFYVFRPVVITSTREERLIPFDEMRRHARGSMHDFEFRGRHFGMTTTMWQRAYCDVPERVIFVKYDVPLSEHTWAIVSYRERLFGQWEIIGMVIHLHSNKALAYVE